MEVMQRRQGWARRPYTYVVSPLWSEPVVLCVQRPRFAVSSRWASLTNASRSSTSDTRVQGERPRRYRTSHLYRLPMPARLVWSRSASAIVVAGWAAMRRTASAASQSGPRRSGPRCPTRVCSWSVGTSARSCTWYPTAATPAVRSTTRIRWAGRADHRWPVRKTRHCPSMRRCECRVSRRSLPGAAKRSSRCLPRQVDSETLPECQAGGDRREDVPAVERGGGLWGEPLVVGQLDRPQHAAQHLGRTGKQPVVRAHEQAARRLEGDAAPGGTDTRVHHRHVDGRRQVRHSLREHGRAPGHLAGRYLVGDVDDPYGRCDARDHAVA